MTSVLVFWLCATYLAFVASAAAITGRSASNVSSNPFVWASLGDSWASGVTYGLPGRTNFDGISDDCMRSKQAYSVQIGGESTWVPGERPQVFAFQSCVGTPFTGIDRVPYKGHVQLAGIPADINMIMLQAGHDIANLAAVAGACVYKQGNCSQEIARASSYINGKDKDQLFQDVLSTIDSIFGHEKVKTNDHFQLFMPGYVQIFYANGGDGDWCSNATFAVVDNGPLLILELRRSINQLLQDLNAGIKAGIAASSYSGRTHFIDVDPQFNGHRFCQPEHTTIEQYTSDKVYLWNMSPAEANATDPGMSLRTFHPKEIGYRAMTNAIIQNLNTQYGTVTAMESPQSAVSTVAYENSIQILFSEHRGYFSWYVFKGPWGIAVSPCGKREKFKLSAEDMREPRPHKDLSLMNPPRIPAGANWQIEIEGWSDDDRCWIAGDKDGAGSLKCGNPPFLDYPIMPDPGNTNGIIRCLNGDMVGLAFHRAWNVEW
ncbi:hypothetical protein HBI37_091310 [Parastagonospora nodorum]|nr:hypothetical protein HBI37_091310 [Parastagonospora nodorum]KAH6359601.1 hypothetical protein HBI36_069490 [Parastagonospora nodorum]KAH6448493.1 hypothetical protein HBI59_085310 [Parastagonospora nodorum]